MDLSYFNIKKGDGFMKKKILIGVVAVIVAIGAIGSLGGDKKETPATSNSTTQEVPKVTEEAKKEADESVPVEYKSALAKAESYANGLDMSKKSVYKQLISEHGEEFTKDEADYAISKVEANWKENALKKAISYQQDMNMSRKAVYEQLVSEYGEKFTKEEADYALENLPK